MAAFAASCLSLSYDPRRSLVHTLSIGQQCHILSPSFIFSCGKDGLAPALSVGGYTIIMNFVLVALQILVLRRRFNPLQLFQLAVGFVFGWLIDLNMYLTSALSCDTLTWQALTQFAGCTVMGVGIAFEVRCGSVTMPGEGFPVALSQVTGRPFPKMKIIVDTSLVMLAVVSSFVFFGRWEFNIAALVLFSQWYM